MDVLSVILWVIIGFNGSIDRAGPAYIKYEGDLQVEVGPFYHTAELNRFCMTAAQAWNHYELCYNKLSRYEEACRKNDVEIDENYRHYMIIAMNVFLYLSYAKNIWTPFEQRWRYMDRLREELGFFSIGQNLHWFDAGHLPGY